MEQVKSNGWYEKNWIVVVLLIVFFPIGLYALWKNSSIKKGWKIAITVLIALIVIGSTQNKDDKTNEKVASSSVSNNEKSQLASSSNNSPEYKRIGDQIEVGNFSYVVNDAKFAKTIGNEFSQKTADGIFLIASVTFRNNDNEEHTIDNSFFKLTDESGTEFSSSTEGETALEMSGKETLFLKQCNPHITKTGLLIFEVPAKKVYDLNLSGGFWSGKTAAVKLTTK